MTVYCHECGFRKMAEPHCCLRCGSTPPEKETEEGGSSILSIKKRLYNAVTRNKRETGPVTAQDQQTEIQA